MTHFLSNMFKILILTLLLPSAVEMKPIVGRRLEKPELGFYQQPVSHDDLVRVTSDAFPKSDDRHHTLQGSVADGTVTTGLGTATATGAALNADDDTDSGDDLDNGVITPIKIKPDGRRSDGSSIPDYDLYQADYPEDTDVRSKTSYDHGPKGRFTGNGGVDGKAMHGLGIEMDSGSASDADDDKGSDDDTETSVVTPFNKIKGAVRLSSENNYSDYDQYVDNNADYSEDIDASTEHFFDHSPKERLAGTKDDLDGNKSKGYGTEVYDDNLGNTRAVKEKVFKKPFRKRQKDLMKNKKTNDEDYIPMEITFDLDDDKVEQASDNKASTESEQEAYPFTESVYQRIRLNLNILKRKFSKIRHKPQQRENVELETLTINVTLPASHGKVDNSQVRGQPRSGFRLEDVPTSYTFWAVAFVTLLLKSALLIAYCYRKRKQKEKRSDSFDPERAELMPNKRSVRSSGVKNQTSEDECYSAKTTVMYSFTSVNETVACYSEESRTSQLPESKHNDTFQTYLATVSNGTDDQNEAEKSMDESLTTSVDKPTPLLLTGPQGSSKSKSSTQSTKLPIANPKFESNEGYSQRGSPSPLTSSRDSRKSKKGSNTGSGSEAIHQLISTMKKIETRQDCLECYLKSKEDKNISLKSTDSKTDTEKSANTITSYKGSMSQLSVVSRANPKPKTDSKENECSQTCLDCLEKNSSERTLSGKDTDSDVSDDKKSATRTPLESMRNKKQSMNNPKPESHDGYFRKGSPSPLTSSTASRMTKYKQCNSYGGSDSEDIQKVVKQMKKIETMKDYLAWKESQKGKKSSITSTDSETETEMSALAGPDSNDNVSNLSGASWAICELHSKSDELFQTCPNTADKINKQKYTERSTGASHINKSVTYTKNPDPKSTEDEDSESEIDESTPLLTLSQDSPKEKPAVHSSKKSNIECNDNKTCPKSSPFFELFKRLYKSRSVSHPSEHSSLKVGSCKRDGFPTKTDKPRILPASPPDNSIAESKERLDGGRAKNYKSKTSLKTKFEKLLLPKSKPKINCYRETDWVTFDCNRCQAEECNECKLRILASNREFSEPETNEWTEVESRWATIFNLDMDNFFVTIPTEEGVKRRLYTRERRLSDELSTDEEEGAERKNVVPEDDGYIYDEILSNNGVGEHFRLNEDIEAYSTTECTSTSEFSE